MRTRSGDVGTGEQTSRAESEVGRGRAKAVQAWLPGRAEIDNWRWSGVPFFIRAGEAAGHGHGGAGFFKTTPWLGFVPKHAPFASMGGEGPIAYEVLLQAAMVGDPSHFARQDALEEKWRVVHPLVGDRPPVEVYEKGTWGAESADKLVREYGGWHDPGLPE